MKFIRQMYHFLGGIHFALFLIASVAFFVVIGTFIESSTNSHRYAALLTYSHPFFGLLLWGFFVNILFSATRRWPFQSRHIPFLITHIGLLMILGGVIIKHNYGVQGTMSLLEGSGSHEIYETGSYAIQVQDKQGKVTRYPFTKTLFGHLRSEIVKIPNGLEISLREFYPHSKEQLTSWIKNDYVRIQGLSPLRLDNDRSIKGKVRFFQTGQTLPWELYATTSVDIEKTVKDFYSRIATIQITDKKTQTIIASIPLEKLLNSKVTLPDSSLAVDHLSGELLFPFSETQEMSIPVLKMTFRTSKENYNVEIALKGPTALINSNKSTPYLGDFPFAINILMKPALCVIEDEQKDCYFFAFDAYGRIWSKSFFKDNIQSLLVYDEGFGGYAIRAELPFDNYPISREEIEDALKYHLKQQLADAVKYKKNLSPPLNVLLKACEATKIDFPETCLTFLQEWNNAHQWLYPEAQRLPQSLATVLEFIDWNDKLSTEQKGCLWCSQVFFDLENPLQKKTDLLQILQQKKWPLLSLLESEILLLGKINEEEKTKQILLTLTRQIFAAAEQLPPSTKLEVIPVGNAEKQAHLLSAYFRAYDIHLSSLIPDVSKFQMEDLIQEFRTHNKPESLIPSKITLESSVLPFIEQIAPLNKLEDNIPKIVLNISKDGEKQKLILAYDRSSSGLKWPVLNGSYLLRFQPMFISIPFHVRLRTARQVNYANSSQAFSYEGDLILTDRRSGEKEEKTISMNQVHETWDGYRFYLSSMSPASETAVKRVQIVINYDPAKYFLTYPGALILSLGIILLFSLRPYRKNPNDPKI